MGNVKVDLVEGRRHTNSGPFRSVITGIYRTQNGALPNLDELCYEAEKQIYQMVNNPATSMMANDISMMRGRDVVLVILKEDASMRKVEYVASRPMNDYGLMPEIRDSEPLKYMPPKKEDNNILLLLN